MAVDGITATYIAANQFSVTGNQTADFHAGRRVKAELTGGDVYSTISGSVFGAVTTVTLYDSELDNTLTKVWYGIGWGSEGSLPDHTHDSSEGSGAQFTSLVFLAPATIGVPDNTDLITLSSGVVTFDSPITIGNSDLGNVPGSMRWTGADLEYNDGIAWQSLTGGGGTFLEQDGSTPLTGDWDFGSFTISGTGDIWCNDLHTAGASLYVGDVQLTSDANVLNYGTNTISGTGDVAAGRLGVGEVVDLSLQTSVIQVISENLGWLSVYKYSDDAYGAAPNYYKARGTYASPAAVQASDVVGGYNVNAHDGTQFDVIGKVRHLVESISAGNVKSYIEFHVSDASGVVQEMARINSTGFIVGDGVDQQADYPLHVKDSSAYVSIEGTGTTSLSAILFEKQGNLQWSMYNDGANSDVFILESDGVNMYSIAIGRTYGDIGIGYKGPNLPNSTTRLSIIADESSAYGLLTMYQHSEDASGSAFSGYSSRGADQVNPTAVVASDVITGYNAFAHDGTVFDLVGRCRHIVESINLGDIASYWELHTSDISGTSREVVRIHSTGDLELYEGALILANYGSIGVPGRIDIITVSSGTTNIVEFDGHIRATLSGTYDIGTPDYPFRDIYLTGGSVYLNAEKISSPSAGIVDFNNATLVNVTISGGGVTDHSALNELDYASAGHTGFVSIATDQTITGAKTFTQDVTISGSLTATASGTFGYLEVTDSISEIQFTSASGIIGVAGDSDLIQLEPEQVTIVGTANSRMVFQTVSGTIGVYNNEDMITFTAAGTLGSHSADLYFDNQTTVEFGYKAYFDHAVVVSGTIGIPGDESLLDLSNNQLTVGGLSATIEFGTSSGTIGVSDNTDLMELTTTAVVFDGHIRATVSGAYDIGEIDLPFRDIYLTGGSIYLDGSSISLDAWGNFDFGDKQIITTGPLQMGNTVETNPGLMRWTGTDFEGYKGSEWVSLTASGSGGSSTFTGLTDTPADYTGHAGKSAVVKGDETGLEFVTVSGGGGGGDLLADGTVPMTANWPFGNYSLFIGDNANANMTIGLTINQGANDDSILEFKSSDVAHGFNNWETDSYARFKKISGNQGGLLIQCARAGGGVTTAFMTSTNTDESDTTKSTTGRAATELTHFYYSGGGAYTDFPTDANILSIRCSRNATDEAIWIADEGGNTWQSGGATFGGNVGIGGSPDTNHRLNISGNAGGTFSNTQVNFSYNDVDAGGYLMSGGNSSCIIGGGVAWEGGGTWRAKDSNASMVYQNNGDILFYANTGLTGGTTFSPTLRMQLDTSVPEFQMKSLNIDFDNGYGIKWDNISLIGDGNAVYINDTTNANMTIGLTINQGANDDEILAFKSSDVNQPFTTYVEADTYYSIQKLSATAGGAKIRALSDGDARAFKLEAFMGTTDPTDTTPAIQFAGYKSDGGTDVAALASSETVFQIQNLSTNLLTILGSGETLQTGPLGIGSQASVASNSPLLLVYSASASARINLEGTSSGADGAIGFYKTGEDAFAGIYGENTGVGAGDLRFATDDGATHSEKMRITGGGLIGINESSNTDMTIGLTINQGANNDEIIGVKRTGHNHSFTDLAETDTYGTLGVFDDSVGGIKWRGYSTGNRAATIQAFTTTQDTTKSTAGLGCIEFNAFGQTAATYGNLSDAANIVVIRGYSGGASLTKWICDENGETWQSGGATFGGDIYCVDVIPTVSGSGNVGSAQKPWAQVYLADQATGDVYGVTIVSGTITTTLV